jgi:alkanesulfonate monooxygenase SsuD/methylene tetrahydromethanopterin reductase-like flavin-dependent oxidoreductase (luciferase family)
MERDQFEFAAGPQGALFVGSAETVAAKIVRAAQALGLARFDMKYSMGTLPHHKLMASIRRYATDVVPLVQAQLAPTALP